MGGGEVGLSQVREGKRSYFTKMWLRESMKSDRHFPLVLS
jgi:hypothetical protein